MIEFDLGLFYEKVNRGEPIDSDEIKKYIESFSNVVVWGGGNLGTEVATLFKKLEITVTVFWDKRYDEIHEIEGIQVVEPYTEMNNKDRTLIVYCIGSVAMGPVMERELKKRGWDNILKGMYLYQGLICTLSVEKPFEPSICAKNKLCTLCNCEKMNSIMAHKQAEKKQIPVKKALVADRVHFIINNFCNMKCTYCIRYMNSYPPEKKKNSDFETIKYVIQRVMGALDSVAVGIVFGGEPFLHPNLDRIIGELLKQDNLGAVLINTNGIANIKNKSLKYMKNPKVRIAFSNYTHVLNEKQQQEFWENAEYLDREGTNVQVQNTEPTWTEVTTLENKGSDKNECIEKRKNCDFPYLYVYEYKVFPCAFAMSLYDLGVADYEDNYVDVREYEDDESLGLAIRQLRERDYLRSCAHCAVKEEVPVRSAEQGFHEKYAIPR